MLTPEIKIHAKNDPAQLIENNERTILFCNEAFMRLFDIRGAVGELLGTSCIDLIISISNTIPDVERLSAFVARSLANRLPGKIQDVKINTRTAINIEFKSLILKDGTLIHIWEYLIIN
jgi:hypothetical protein